MRSGQVARKCCLTFCLLYGKVNWFTKNVKLFVICADTYRRIMSQNTVLHIVFQYREGSEYMEESILLDVGTGELEVIVFVVNGNSYCINVLKAREIIQLSEVRAAADQNKSILGLTNVRNQVMTVVDLSYILDKKQTDLSEKKMALVCEFNKKQVMFAVDSITGIQRVKWSDITKPDSLVRASLAVGNILTDNGILLMLDFEKIIADLSKDQMEQMKNSIAVREERKTKRIYMADDSKTIRELLKETLGAAGYTNIKEFDNGKDVLEAIFDLKDTYGSNFNQELDLLITDIEMPILDGHSVTRKIKEDNILNTLPVVIFSSLITEDLHHKGEKVGADRQISKPSIGELVNAVDSLLF